MWVISCIVGSVLYRLAVAFARLADPSAVADPPLRGAMTRIRDAMYATIREGKTLTGDLGGTATTDQFTSAIIARLR